MTSKTRKADLKSAKDKAIEILKHGGVGVMPTDTIYGIVGSALNPETVERIYKVRRKTPSKPMIILISSVGELSLFGVNKKSISFATPFTARHNFVKMLAGEKSNTPAGGYASRENDIDFLFKTFWPGKVSVILPIETEQAREKFFYLHRGTNSLAFRLPDDEILRELIFQTGPLVAPSANLEGELPATNIEEAEKYFGNQVDFYIDGGEIIGSPSKLIKIDNGKIVELRK